MKDKKDKIYYFQEKSNDILDLQDELKKENANQRCKFFGDINKFNLMIDKLFDVDNGLLVNNAWLSEINGIKLLSEKRKEIAKSRWETEQQKKDSKPKRNPKKPKETQLVIYNSIYKELADNLLSILETKLQKKLSSNKWEDEIRKLIEIDLKIRQNPIQDVELAIKTIADNYGKEYFPIIQSAGSLREKFIKIEDFIKRNNQPKKQTMMSQLSEPRNYEDRGGWDD
jgi:hypothetical protein